MKKIELTYVPYSLELSKPFNTSRGPIKERHGYLIKLTDQFGNFGIGDASPFPEFGSESFSDTENKLENIKLEIKIDLSSIEDSINSILSPIDTLPSLRHGIEQALLNLICKDKKITLNQLLGRSSLKILNVNAVLGLMSPEESADSAEQFLNQGYSCLKLKIGRQTFKQDLECIQAVKDRVGEKIRIRLDVNGKWNLNEAAEYTKLLEDYNIEYLEQPVSSLENFLKLKELTQIPLAADESIRTVKDADKFIERNAAEVLILKPMMIGGIIPTLRIIDKAYEKGIKSVISSSFESALGRSFAVFLASLVHDNIAHGLSTAGYFAEDILQDPYQVKDGKIFL